MYQTLLNEYLSKMKVAIYLASLSGGGAEKMMIKVANYLSSLGHEVDLLVCRRQGEYFDLVNDEVNVIVFDVNKVSKSLLKLVEYLTRVNPAALLSAMNYVNAVAAVAIFLARCETKHVVSERSHFSSRYSKLNFFKKIFFKKFMKWCYARSEKVVAISEGVKIDLCKTINLDPNKVVVIYNPAYPDDIFERLGCSVDKGTMDDLKKKYIISVGRLEPQKNFLNLLNAVSLIRDKTNIELIILGKGSLEESLKSYCKYLKIEDIVTFIGFKTNPYPYMSRADVFVLSSDFEGFGNVIVEAMACGTSIVATDCPSGPTEILDNGRWGTLVPINDAQALAIGIEKSLSDDDGNIDVELRAKEFSIKKIGKQYLALLEFNWS